MKQYLGVFLALIRHYVNDEVIEVIKRAVKDVAHRSDWGPGEKTEYVFKCAREVAESTDTPVDDFLVELAIKFYMKKYNVN